MKGTLIVLFILLSVQLLSTSLLCMRFWSSRGNGELEVGNEVWAHGPRELRGTSRINHQLGRSSFSSPLCSWQLKSLSQLQSCHWTEWLNGKLTSYFVRNSIFGNGKTYWFLVDLKNGKSSNAGSQFRCGLMGRGGQPPSTPEPSTLHTTHKRSQTIHKKYFRHLFFHSSTRSAQTDKLMDHRTDKQTKPLKTKIMKYEFN